MKSNTRKSKLVHKNGLSRVEEHPSFTVKLFDTTLRDGTQGEGISISVEDKLKVAKVLDELGVHYIEGGWPGSNPKDELFFKRATKELKLKQAKLVAFSSTRRKGRTAAKDDSLLALLASNAPALCVFGKTWDAHVHHALRVSLDENIDIIRDTVAFLKSKKREVIYDAEHFFDGFKANPSYALATVKAAMEAGADNVTLCDTNGGCLPFEVTEIVRDLKRHLPTLPLGIHAHNDSNCAVANSLAAVQEGVELVQGTLNGYGERCGNANLGSIIANLNLKLGLRCVPDEKLKTLTEVSRYIDELANVVPIDSMPYVGNSAFAHKGGVHVSAVARSASYEHIDPGLVGNKRRILISELSGKANVSLKASELKLNFEKDSDAVSKVLALVKQKENLGFQYEGAEGSFILLVEEALGKRPSFFELESFRVGSEKEAKSGHMVSEATLKIKIDRDQVHTVSEGDGPVDALDKALRKALMGFYPNLEEMSLVDFKVRVINGQAGTAARVRVLINSRDLKSEWATVGVSENVIEAAWQALRDATEYKLFKDKKSAKKTTKKKRGSLTYA